MGSFFLTQIFSLGGFEIVFQFRTLSTFPILENNSLKKRLFFQNHFSSVLGSDFQSLGELNRCVPYMLTVQIETFLRVGLDFFLLRLGV